VLVQPYLDAVDGDEGEIALVFIDGELSHAMHKGSLLALDVPAVEAGFRQEQMSLVPAPAADIVAFGRRALEFVHARFGGPLLYARVDVLRDGAGDPAVLELELIEPSLFLDFAPGSAHALARAIVARVGG
jgi:O-ureido-D-serine cyclo-ligase